MAIPLLLAYLLVKMKVKLQYNWIIWMFVAFIFGCGMTHFMGIVVFYNPMYRLDGLVKLATGIISLATVIALAWLVPKALAREAPSELVKIVGKVNKQLKLFYLLVLALVIMVGADLWGMTSVNQVKDSVQWRIHTIEALRQIENINVTTARAESAERGYIITGSENYLTEFDVLNKNIPTDMAVMRKFVSDNKSQVERIDKMNSLILERQKQLDETIKVRKTQGLEIAAKLIQGRDQRIQTEIKQLQADMVTEEEKLLEMRSIKLNDDLRMVVIVNITAAAVGASIIIFTFVLMMRQQQVIGYANDRLKDNEILLTSANKELSQFAYIASHDLKAPLRAVNNLVQWIEEDIGGKELTDDTKRHMQLVHERITRMNALIDGILQYSRIGRMYTDKEELDCNRVVKDVIAQLDTKKFTMVVSPLPTIVGNNITLGQLFTNLIGNAVKHHTRDDGHVWITATDLGKEYEFSVKDDGPGIEATFMPKLFGMFQTGKQTTPDSTGIGLALCKKIVEFNGGRIWCESEYGHGANFKFTWPK